MEVIKFEFNLKLKINRNDWLLADTCSQAADHVLYLEFETVFKFYHLEARSCSSCFSAVLFSVSEH